jgi:geranylgeranyl pyrophosphate synthase
MIAETFGLAYKDVKEILYLCEFVHNGSLMIDDLEDAR